MKVGGIMKLGEVIKKYREKHDLSLREFAEKCGLSHAYIAKLEDGKDPRTGKEIEPTLDTVNKIAVAINMSLDELLKIIGYLDTPSPVDKITDSVSDDPELAKFWDELKEREDLQLLFKQTREMSPEDVKKIIRIIKAIEDEEAADDSL